MTWTQRRATPADVDALMALELEIYPDDPWSHEIMASELASEHSYYLVALGDDGAIDAYAGLLAPIGTGQGDIQTMSVAPRARRHGLARTMMLQLLNESRRRRADELFLEVRHDNEAAQALYRDLGFEVVGVRPRYYKGGVDALSMRLIVPPAAASVVEPVETSVVEPDPPVVEPDPSVVEPVETPPPLVLGIETSCDETGIGIVRGDRLLANAIASSMEEHARYGGVVPEVAARAHLEALTPTLDAALAEAGVALSDVDAIAVTSGPGLAGALMVGVGAAKALAVALDKPLYAVNHLVGHVGADLLTPVGEEGDPPLELPAVALLVSGGHTSLLLVRSLTDDVELLGETVDDAAGEAFDKVARLLGLPYPGGPEIDRAAATGDPQAIRFPRGLTAPKDRERHRYDFSFSGLKTAVARWVEAARERGDEVPVADVAASFREAVVDVLTAKAIDACTELGVPRLLLGGGVVANARLRAVATERAAAAGVELRIPPLSLCTDNGAMIAAVAARLIAAGHAPSSLDVGADSTLPVTVVQA